MPWNLKNVALDPAFAGKRRCAAKMEMEPVIAGARIRLRGQVTISDEMYEINKDRIDTCVKHGVLTAISSEPAKKAAPKKAATPDPVEPSPAPEPEPEPAPEPPPAPTPAPPAAEEKAPAPSRKSSKKSSKKGNK